MKKDKFLKILIMGLPSSGKTTLSNALFDKLITNKYKVLSFNADLVRKFYNDWDFSYEGRLRQANRMHLLVEKFKAENDFIICDFVCPKKEFREAFNADYTVYMDTITASSYEDTNKIFEPPRSFDFKVTDKNADFYASLIYSELIKRRNAFSF